MPIAAVRLSLVARHAMMFLVVACFFAVGDGDGGGGGGECRRNLDVPRLAFARERRASRTSGTASLTSMSGVRPTGSAGGTSAGPRSIASAGEPVGASCQNGTYFLTVERPVVQS